MAFPPLRCVGFRVMLRVPLFSLIAARSLSAGQLSSGGICSKFSTCSLALHPYKFSQRAQIPLFKFCSRSFSGIQISAFIRFIKYFRKGQQIFPTSGCLFLSESPSPILVNCQLLNTNIMNCVMWVQDLSVVGVN